MIAPAHVAARQQQGEAIELIDVRTPVEFAALHALGARNVPLDRIGADDVGPGVCLICQSGTRAKQDNEKLGGELTCVEGGTAAWQAAGLPVIEGKKTISLERQVRISAGSLVLLGVIIGILIHPGWLGISAFVGAGLVFAGITDTCGMGLMLAKMPWNR